MKLERNELLLLKNFTIRLEFVHSVVLGRFAPEVKYGPDGQIIEQDMTSKMELSLSYFTPAGLQRFKIHADTELELLVLYGEVLGQMGVSLEEIIQTQKTLTEELKPDGLHLAPETEGGGVELHVVKDKNESTTQPA